MPTSLDPTNPACVRPRRLGRRRTGAALLALAALTAGLVQSPAATAASTTATTAYVAPVPAVPTGLPTALEELARYVPASSCDPHAKPGATALGDLLRATYPGSSYGIDRTCGTDPLPTSEHYDGRAIDWFRSVRDPQQKADAQAVIAWLFAKDAAGNAYANARRLGVMYLIWNNRIWGSYRADEGWRAYSSCASHPEAAYDTTCHRDHIHFSLSWEGAMQRTSFWTAQVAGTDYGPCRAADLNWADPYRAERSSPCPSYPRVVAPTGASALEKSLTTYSGMVLSRGSAGPAVRAVQQAVGTGVDGAFGPDTVAAVKAWKVAHGLPDTGVVGADTWRALLAANAPATTTPEPTTPAATGTTTRASSPLTPYRHLVLRVGSRGPAVRALQRRLHVRVDGVFGRVTRRAVYRFKVRHHLAHDGVVGPRVWRALGA